MNWPNPASDGFSPYRDPEPINEFYEDFSRRGTTSLFLALLVHVLFFLLLQPTFVLPNPEEEEEPETITIDIVAFEDLQPEPEPVIEPEPAPIIPIAPAVTPQVKPEPKPVPPPPPPQPQPQPEPEPEPEPEPVEPEFIPPPDILATPTIEPADTPDLEPIIPPEPEVEPIIEPEPVIQEPIIEQPILEPIIQEPIQEPEPIIEQEPIFEPVPEPVYEWVQEPIQEPEPEPEPVLEPEPIFPESEIIEEPLLEPLEDITEPLPGTQDPIFEPIEPAPITPPIQQEDVQIIDPEPVAPDPIETDIIQPEPETPVITTAPTVLASPDAPETVEELDRAVPQSQADQMFDPLQRPSGGPAGGGNPAISGPSTGGGGIPPSGGTQRGNPGSAGWTLDPSSLGGQPGEGYGGLIEDIRCRELDRTHEDCPEYMPQFEGRNAAGFESFGAHSTSGIQSARRAQTGIPANGAVGGNSDLWSGGGIGDNSFNNGGPSTTVLGDADFGREFLSTPLGDGTQSGRVRDLFGEPKQPVTGLDNLILPPDPEEDE